MYVCMYVCIYIYIYTYVYIYTNTDNYQYAMSIPIPQSAPVQVVHVPLEDHYTRTSDAQCILVS